MKQIIIVGFSVLVIGYVGFLFLNPDSYNEEQGDGTYSQEQGQEEVAVVDGYTSDIIKITAPTVGAVVGSPLMVSGEARGYWFFEASAPVVVTNWNGLIIGEGFIQAQEDWMTEDFVPFTGEITYTQEATPYSATGTVIFMRDNPSGLPENDAAIEVTVQLQKP